MTTGWLFLSMLAAAGCVIVSGQRLVGYGDSLGLRLGLSSTWVGVILLAALTSLPELVVTLSAQLAVSRPALVMGNVCGSNLFNLCIFAFMDLLSGPGAMSAVLSPGLLHPALMGALVMAIAVAGFLLAATTGGGMALGCIFSVAIVGVYVYAMWRTHQGDSGQEAEEEVDEESAYGHLSLRALLLRFAFLGAVLVVGGTVFIMLCEYLLEHPPTIAGYTFRVDEGVVGTVLVAFVTSLPELVVCFAAVRMGKLDLAVGNLLGSNIFNMTLLPVAHLVRPLDDFWGNAMPVHVYSLFVAMILSLILAAGIKTKAHYTIGRLGIDGLLITIFGGATLLYVAMSGVSAI